MSEARKEYPDETVVTSVDFIQTHDTHIVYDPAKDTVQIFGIVYSMNIFRALGFSEPGTWLRIDDRRQSLEISTVPQKLERAFDLIAGRGRFRR